MAKLTGKAKAKFLARMKKGRKAAKKSPWKKGSSRDKRRQELLKSGGKKKLLTRKNLEARVKSLEDQLSGKTFMEQGLGETLGEHERTKRRLDCGDW